MGPKRHDPGERSHSPRRGAIILATLLVAVMLLVPGNLTTGAPLSATSAISTLLELAFTTRLTEAQRADVAAIARGAPQEQQRALVKGAGDLQAEFASTEAWLRETRWRARQWVEAAAQGDPGLTAIVKNGDPNGAAPSLSLRARDAVIEMLLNWVQVGTGRGWEGGEADVEALRADVVRWYRAANDETRGLYQQADRIWGGLRARWNTSKAAVEQSKAQLRRDLPGLIVARQQGGRRWWTHPAVPKVMQNGTFLWAAAASAIRADLSLVGDPPYYEAAELNQPAAPGSSVTKRQIQDIVLFFSFALDAVLTLSEADAIAGGFGDPRMAQSPQIREVTNLLGQIVSRVRGHDREVADARKTLRQQFLANKGPLGALSRDLQRNLQPLIAGDPYQLNRQHLESIAEFLIFSDSVRAGRWIVLDNQGRGRLVSALLAFFKQAGTSDRLMLAIGDVLWGEFRETPDYRRAADRLGPMPAPGAVRPGQAGPAGGSTTSDPGAVLRSERTNDMIQRSFDKAFTFNIGLFRRF